MRRIISLVKKELIQFRRDRKMLGVVLIAPIIQLILLGYAANMDVKIINMTILDFDKSSTSRKFIHSLLSSNYFRVYRYADNYKQVEEDINSGKALIAFVIPKDFEREINKSLSTSVQVILDGSNGNKTTIVFGYVVNATSHFNSKILKFYIKNINSSKFSTKKLIKSDIRVWYNPEMVTRKFLLPGIVALLLLIIAIPLTSMAIVKERENGTIEQILISPLRSYELIAGKLIPFMLIGFLDFTFVLFVMVFWFGIEIKGSIVLLYLTAFLFTFTNLGIGLFISTISRSQQQAMIISVFAVIVPMIYLSGFVFPIENMPKIIQPITYIFPLKYFLIILRGIVLKGLGIDYLWKENLILLTFGVVFFIFSSWKFRKVLN